MNPREGMTAGRAGLPQRYSIQGLQMLSRAPSDLINTSVPAIQRKFPSHRLWGEYGDPELCCMILSSLARLGAALVGRSLGGQQEETRTAQNGPE